MFIDKFLQFVTKLFQSVAVKIFMSKNFNDVPTNDLISHRELVQVTGSCNRDKLYLDLFGGWTDTSSAKMCNLLKLEPDEFTA